MNNIEIYIDFFGHNFSAKSLAEKLSMDLTIDAEKGNIAVKGLNKNKPYPYSSAEYIVVLKNKKHLLKQIEEFVSILKNKKDILKEFDIEEIVIKIFFEYKTNFFTITLDRNGKLLDIDESFAVTTSGKEFLEMISKKSIFPQNNEVLVSVKQDDFMLKGYSGGITENKYHQTKHQKNTEINKINSKKLKYTF